LNVRKRVTLVLLALYVMTWTNVGAQILHEQRSLYSRILVKQTGSTICLQFNVRTEQRNQSCIDKRRPQAMVFAYTRMSMSSLLFAQTPQSILVIGLGGGTLPSAFHSLYPEAKIDAVEIDPAVVSVARKYFDFKTTPNLRVHTRDARVWTKRAAMQGAQYDIIVLDAFNGEYIPEHLMTMEYLQETRALLAPQGTLIANTFAVSALYDHESVTYAKVFGDFINFRIPESANRMIIVPGTHPDEATLRARAQTLLPRLRAYNVPIRRYARIIAEGRNSKPDWRPDARILTDQFSPANLLQGR